MRTHKTNSSQFKQKLTITIGALIVFAFRLAFPALQIDGVSLGILVIAILPWLSSLIKSAELPGVGKIEFQDVKTAAEMIESAEPATTTELSEDQASYLAVAEQNPALSLVGLRIEIEKRLRSLAERAGLPRSRSLTQLTRDLADNKILAPRSVAGLLELINLGNQAAHGVDVAENATYSAVEFGPKVLRTLDAKLQQMGKT